MGNRHRFNKMLLETRLYGGLDFFDTTDFPLDLSSSILIYQGNMGATTCRVTRRCHAIEFAVGNQTQHHGVLDIDVRAKSSGQPDAINSLDAKLVHQQSHPGIKRRLSELNCTHIFLSHRYTHLASMQNKSKCFTLRNYPVRSFGQTAVNHAIRADDTGKIHLTQHLDNARAADPGDSHRCDRLLKTRIVRP